MHKFELVDTKDIIDIVVNWSHQMVWFLTSEAHTWLIDFNVPLATILIKIISLDIEMKNGEHISRYVEHQTYKANNNELVEKY